MRLAIDLRSLQTGSISGVENYILNLTEHILQQDQKNEYALFYNSFKPQIYADFHFVNSKLVATRFPNKILNASFNLFSYPKIEQLVGKIDGLILPNFNSFAIRPETKLIVTVHDLSPVVLPEFYNLKRRLWHKFLNFKKILNRADLILTVSEYTKSDLLRLYNISEQKIHVVYPGLDNNMLNPDIPLEVLRQARNDYSLPGNFLLFLSTIEPRKNLSGLIEAFENLKEDAFLVIAGKKGWKYRSLMERIKYSKKASKIKYLGYVKEEDKPALIKLSRAVIYPSFYEGFGFVPLEAQSLGVPSLISSVTSLPEVCGGASLAFNPYNTEEMTRAISDILENEPLRKELIAEGLNSAKKYQWGESAKKTISLINKLYE